MSPFRPVVIVGAPRSGTNMLRDVLCALPTFGTWPCDEINYVWRHGNVRFPSDEFPPALARPEVVRYVRGRFAARRRRLGGAEIVEKTCANSLRVGFVDRIVPEARYLFIRRDGMDAVASALERWAAPAEWRYLARKARFVPVTDLPYYGGRYLVNRVYKLVSGRRRLAFWGPALDDMRGLLERHPLEEVCALQWQRCVDRSRADLASIAPERRLEVVYEDFVARPPEELARILDFVQADADGQALARATATVNARSVGRGRAWLGPDTVARLEGLVGGTLAALGYR